MNRERNALKAGLFIVVSVILIVVIVVSIKGMAHFTEPRHTRTALFKLTDDLGGLRTGDDVRLGGYKVGTVQTIEPVGLDKGDAGAGLAVTFTIPRRFPLHADARLGVQVTLTGSACLNIESPGSPDKPTDGQLVGRPDPKTLAFASLADAGPDISGLVHDVRSQTVPKVNAAVDTFRGTGEAGTQLVTHLNAKVDPIVSRYDGVTEKAGGALDGVREMVGPSTGDFHGTLADLHEITGGVKKRLPDLLTKIDTSVDRVQKAMEEVQKTVENTRDVSAEVKNIISNNRGKLEAVIASLKVTGDNLKAGSAEIRHSPWRLLYQPKTGELENLNLYDSARQFAEGATELNDAAQALRDATANKSADPERVKKLVVHLQQTFDHFQDVERKLWAGVRE